VTASTQLTLEQIQLLSSSNLKAISDLASSVSHDLNNPLMILYCQVESIKSLVSHSQTDFDFTELLQELSKMETTLQRINNISKSLKVYTRHSDLNPKKNISAKNLIQEALELISLKLKKSKVQMLVSNDIELSVFGNYSQLTQSLVNILKNAIEATEGEPNPIVELKSFIKDNSVVIQIIDNGPGIENKDQIFHAFFTTKPKGIGAGLGLTIAEYLISSNGGQLTINEDHSHTCFQVEFPIATDNDHNNLLAQSTLITRN
jgi:C4-dicarboxylate-specific signal transduction histidine kinase